MSVSEYGVYPEADDLMEQAAKFDLHKHMSELHAYGVTVVPADKMHLSAGFADRLRTAILRVASDRSGIEVTDELTLEDAARITKGWHLLEEDDVFVEAATNPVCLALVRWMLGQSAIFSGQTYIIKPNGSRGLGLHSDSHGVPPGGGSIAHMVNASFLATDYTEQDDGPTVFVPGSHHQCRAPMAHESDLAKTPHKVVPIIGKAGSLAIWNGATWHGSAARTKPGMRVTLVQNYMRNYMRVQHNYENTSPELFEQYPELERIVGKSLYPYEDPTGGEGARVAPFMRAGQDPFF